jgi:hypothetical protein
MRSVNIQFHMLFDELIDFVSEVTSRYRLQVGLERFYPKASAQVPLGADLAREVGRFGHVDRIWLLYKPANSRKAERFMLNVGTQRGARLAQAQVGAGASVAEAYQVLKKVALDLKDRTRSGIGVITAAGNVGYNKKFRVSEGATNAARAGKIELTIVGGGQSFRVDPPELEESQPHVPNR